MIGTEPPATESPAHLERLTEAAAAALADVGPTLELEPGRLQFVTVEIGLGDGGQPIEAVVWAQRTARVRRGS